MDAAVYYDLILSSLSALARKAFEMSLENYEFQHPLLRASYQRGNQEGLEQGLAQGVREDVFAVLEARQLSVTPQQRKRIEECSDVETLRRWLRSAVTVSSSGELFE